MCVSLCKDAEVKWLLRSVTTMVETLLRLLSTQASAVFWGDGEVVLDLCSVLTLLSRAFHFPSADLRVRSGLPFFLFPAFSLSLCGCHFRDLSDVLVVALDLV